MLQLWNPLIAKLLHLCWWIHSCNNYSVIGTDDERDCKKSTDIHFIPEPCGIIEHSFCKKKHEDETTVTTPTFFQSLYFFRFHFQLLFKHGTFGTTWNTVWITHDWGQGQTFYLPLFCYHYCISEVDYPIFNFPMLLLLPPANAMRSQCSNDHQTHLCSVPVEQFLQSQFDFLTLLNM